MKKYEPSKWNTIEDENFVIVVPQTDIKPHGTKITDTEYELTNECECNPKIIAGEKGEVYAKPIVLHNSFEDMERVEKSLLDHI